LGRENFINDGLMVVKLMLIFVIFYASVIRLNSNFERKPKTTKRTNHLNRLNFSPKNRINLSCYTNVWLRFQIYQPSLK